MLKKQENAFWEAIDAFDKEGLLPYVMLIGSWAEYIYQFYFKSEFAPNLKTRDVDFLYLNLRRPKNDINITSALREKGFIYAEDRLSGVGKFIKEDLLELEFITRVIGKEKRTYKIPSIGIEAEALRVVNMLADYPLELECRDYILIVPEPGAYILQKLLTNPVRVPPSKKEKDIQAVRELLKHINIKRLHEIFDKLTDKNKKTIMSVCEKNYIDLEKA
ncbi:MAG: nucleotidyltransferase domain-containing protein [Oscillospiraceae bacterium]|jgi:hypothetical protein|nr:nucleotidyltransferase domain-containing protein [Oscillospiraceae bacterium]